MAATDGDLRVLPAAAMWRTPLVIGVCGCLIGMLTFGPRSSLPVLRLVRPLSLATPPSVLGAVVFEKFGSYAPIWWLSLLFGALSALINLPIIEAPVKRPVAQPA
jgi:hypothetical protein